MSHKKILSIFLILLLVISISNQSFAHSGRTDSNGGHTDSKTGRYHYHNSGTSGTTNSSNATSNILADEVISELKSMELELETKSKQLESLITELEEISKVLPEQIAYLNQLTSDLETVYKSHVPFTDKITTIPTNIGFSTEKSRLSEPVNIFRTYELIWELDLDLWKTKLNNTESSINSKKNNIEKFQYELINKIEKLEAQKDALIKSKLDSDLLALITPSILNTDIVHQQNNISVSINGKHLEMPHPPINEKGRVLVPLRSIFESLGLIVNWNPETRTVIGTKNNQTISLTIGESTAYINRKPVTLDVPSMIINSTTFVPVRFISESIGANVNWDEAKRTVIITLPTAVPQNDTLRIHYLDVGQADSILVQTPSGNNMLIDAGNNADSNTINSYLKDNGVEKIDALILTHPHEDHIGSAYSVITNFEVSKLYMPKVTHTTATFENLLNIIKKKDLKITPAIAGMKIDIDPDIAIEFLAPNSATYEDLNNYSAVVKITYRNTSFLFMGDAENISESEILKKKYDIRADVIKIGHHGGKTSTTESFVKTVSPKHAIISVGQGNNFGHPSNIVIDRLTSLGINTYRTDLLGTIIAESDGVNIVLDRISTDIK